MSRLWCTLALLVQVTFGVNPLDSIPSTTLETVLQGVEARLAQHGKVHRQLLEKQTAAMEAKTDALETRLERIVIENRNVITNSESRLDLTIGAKIKDMEERMVVENVNLVTNWGCRLNLAISAMMNKVEERMVVENHNLATNCESRLNLPIGAIMKDTESRLAELTGTMESQLAENTGTIERRLADQTATMESRLTQHAEAVYVRLANLKTDLERSTTDRLEALEERMVVENRNRLNLTIGAMMTNMESRLAHQTGTLENGLVGLAADMESRLAVLTGTIESRLVQQAENVNVRLAALKTDLKNTTTIRLEALEERMVAENHNLVTNSESRLNLAIGAMMKDMEERIRHDVRHVANTTDIQLKEAQTHTNVTVGAVLHGVVSRLAEQSAAIERRLADQTTTIASHLTQHTRAVDGRLATLKTELENSTTDRLEALEERMVVELYNLVTNSESRLNLTIGAMMKDMEAGLTALSSSRGSDQLNASYNCSTAQLQILKPSENRGQVTFLRRVDGSVNFQRNWAEYKSGFGDNNEFWLGLEKLHQLTTEHGYGLHVDMEDYSGEQKWASYQSFRVGGESGNYVLTVSGYNPDSTAGDSMDYHNGMEFTTYDMDNDRGGNNCAVTFQGGWWYKGCHYAKPTGLYGDGTGKGIMWYHAYSDNRSFKFMSLKLVGN